MSTIALATVRTLTPALALLATAGSLAAQNLWVVDSGGGGHFTEIQPAVNAAFDGDTILVEDGTYTSFVIDDRDLVIVAEGNLAVCGTIRIRNLSAPKTLVLEGLTARGGDDCSPSIGCGLFAVDCIGSVRIGECQFEGGNCLVGLPAGSFESCADLSFSACAFLGHDGDLVGSLPGSGLLAVDSKVAIYDGHGDGGDGGDFDMGDPYCASDGAPGAVVTGSGEFFAAGSVFLGGDGGYDWCDQGGFNGGAGLHSTQTPCRLRDCTAAGGAFGCTYSFATHCGVDGPPTSGSVVLLDGHSGSVLDQRVARTNTILWFDITGPPGSMVFVLPGTQPGHEYLDRREGALLLAPPFLHFMTPMAGGPPELPVIPLQLSSPFLGIVPSSGLLQVPVVVKPLLPGAQADTFLLQGILRSQQGDGWLANPICLTVLDCPSCIVDCNSNGVPDAQDINAGTSLDCNGNGMPDECEADCNGNGIPDSCDVASGTSVDCNGSGIPDECELDCNGNGIHDSCDVVSGTSPDCNGNLVPDECEPDCNGNGSPDDCDVASGTSPDCNGNSYPDECDVSTGISPDLNGDGIPDECQGGARVYVDQTAVPGGDGFSWGAAFPELRDAMEFAYSLPGGVESIWVAEGVYCPDSTYGSNDATFLLVDGMKLYGGFDGSETSLDQRDSLAHPAVLSGDLNGNDDTTGSYSDNVESVVTLGWTMLPCRLDGFFISGAHSFSNGGGVTCEVASSTGSADDCVIANCVIEENYARFGAGGMLLIGDGWTIVDCVVRGNLAEYGKGGGAILSGTGWEVVNTVFLANEALENGGGGFVRYSHDSRFVNCVFDGNLAERGGGLDILYTEDFVITACTFAGNTATVEKGGGIRFDSQFEPGSIRSCIAWGNTSALGTLEEQQIWIRPTHAEATFCCIEGYSLLPGTNNHGLDPLLVDPLGPDGIAGTDDDDLRLGPGSPCVDSSRNQLLPQDTADIDHDGNTTEQLPLDLHGNARRIDDPFAPDTGLGVPPILDMGALERVPRARIR